MGPAQNCQHLLGSSQLAIVAGGLGLRSATLLSRPVYWSSWADCLQIGAIETPHRMCAHRGRLACSAPFFPLGRGSAPLGMPAAGFHAPSWQELAAGARPEQLQWDEDMEPGLPRHGWQRRATEPVHALLVEGTIRPRLSPTEQTLFRSQGGPSCTSRLSRMDSSLFPVLLLRRLPPRVSAGVAVHLTLVATTEQLARRQVLGSRLRSGKCRRLGCDGKPVLVSTNVLVRDLDLLPVVANGLPLFHGAQIAVDTTLVLTRDGTPHSRRAREDGAALRQAR